MHVLVPGLAMLESDALVGSCFAPTLVSMPLDSMIGSHPPKVWLKFELYYIGSSKLGSARPSNLKDIPKVNSGIPSKCVFDYVNSKIGIKNGIEVCPAADPSRPKGSSCQSWLAAASLLYSRNAEALMLGVE
eukprot:413461-Amphidinium_carterae.1